MPKQKIVALVERNGGVRAFHVASVNGETLKSVLHGNIAKNTHLMTDDARIYRRIGRHFASHASVNHSAGEYARGNVTTNTVEGFFSILKRGLVGTFHHVAPKHLDRYVTEFTFRYNTRTALGYTDAERADLALKGVSGKRLTYRSLKSRKPPERSRKYRKRERFIPPIIDDEYRAWDAELVVDDVDLAEFIKGKT